MKEKIIKILTCPKCNGNSELELSIIEECYSEIKEGILFCGRCKLTYPIKNYIPRFVPYENYAQSFGLQWNKHARTQIDKYTGLPMSRDRFFQVTKWPENLKGERILEAGCGAGRFTQIAIETGAEVFSFDYSNAVDANFDNNGPHKNLNLFQADIYNIPLKKKSFDKIFCFGVLQHCPKPKEAFLNLLPYLKEGGQIAIDIYALTPRAFVNPKYWLRPFAKRMTNEKLYNLIQKVVPKLYPVKMLITDKIPFGKYFAFFLPVAYHKGFVPHADKLSYEQHIDWSILNTFDKFAPRYDKPQRINAVRKWFVEAGLKNINVCYGPNGITGTGIKP